MASGELTFSFEQLPLLIENGFSAGLVDGVAQIAYHDDDWAIEAIALEGSRERDHAEWSVHYARTGDYRASRFELKPVYLDPTTPIFSAIYDRLENEWRASVQSAVNEARENDRNDAAYDYVRDTAA